MELRREVFAIQQTTRIMMRDNNQLIKVTWDSWKQDDQKESSIFPFGKMNIQIADMASNIDIKMHNLEKEFTYTNSLPLSKETPEYWRTLEPSKSRTTEQEIMSRHIITEEIISCGTDTTICFTDGSCLAKPEPCATGSFIFFPGY